MSGFKDDEDFGEKFANEFKSARSKIKKPNILVLGGTGAGKSSLVNATFGEALAGVGAGSPVTKGIEKYENELIRIFDSEGYESGEEAQKRYKEQVVDFVKTRAPELEDQVHLAWYCISVANHRVFDIDTKTINEIVASKIPVAVIMTQVDQVSEDDSQTLIAVLKDKCPKVTVFEFSTDASVGLTVEPLITWAHNHLDDSLKEGFISSTRSGIELKRKQSYMVIAQHVASAATIAASPIPFSDAPLLVGNQITMIARLASIWNMPSIKSLAAGGIFSQLIAQLGRSLAGNLIKFIPGAGSAVGAAINASIASAITGAVGYAVTEVCERVVEDDLNGVVKDIAEYFDSNLISELIKAKMKGG